jgi:hypothetical protein
MKTISWKATKKQDKQLRELWGLYATHGSVVIGQALLGNVATINSDKKHTETILCFSIITPAAANAINAILKARL